MGSMVSRMFVVEDGNFKVFDLCRGLLYLQGFWQDANEPAEPDPEFYLKYFRPRLAHLLAKHRPLRLALKLFRRSNPWFLMVTMTLRVFYLLPMGMYLYRSESLDVVANLYGIIMEGSQLMAVSTALFQPELMKTIFTEMDVMMGTQQLDNEEQRKIYEKTRSFCRMIIKRIFIPFVSIITIAITLDFYFHLLPERKFLFREWFPWDTITSPAFEITLFVRWMYVVSPTLIAFTLVSAMSICMIMSRSNYKILNNKLENIRPISMNRIKARMLKGYVRLAEETVVDIEFEHSQQVHVPGPAASRGDQLRAGPATALNASRVDGMASLSPLYEAHTLSSPSGRDDMPLEGGVFQGRWPSAGPAAALIERTVDELPRPVSETDSFGYIAGGNEMSLEDCNAQLVNELKGIATGAELDKELNACLAEDIQLHMKLIRFIGASNTYGNIPLIVMLLANTLTLGVTAMVLARPDEVSAFLMISLLFLTVEMATIYLIINNAMQLVSDQHNAVCESLYKSDWIGASPSFKKSMLVIMSRANVPLEMKPTGLDPLSRRNFAEVMNTATNMVSTLNAIF